MNSRPMLAVWVGMILWCAIGLSVWPDSLSFNDETGYVGQARVLLQGRIAPVPTDVGVWVENGDRRFGKYPLFPALVLAPFLAIHPRLVFAPGFLCTLGIVLLASRMLAARNVAPIWALAFLGYPTFVLLARTSMMDTVLAFTALLVGSELRRRSRPGVILSCALLILVKPTGILIGAGWILGACVQKVVNGKFQPLTASRDVGGSSILHMVFGLSLGGVVAVVLNVMQTGGMFYSYSYANLNSSLFSVLHLPSSGAWYLLLVLTIPPLLILGVLPWYRERDLGVLAAIVVLLGVMSVYAYVDRTPDLLRSLVIGPRLILPAVALLLIGWVQLVASVFPGVGGSKPFPWVVLGGVAAMALTMALQHASLHRDGVDARHRAEAIAAELGVGRLGLTFGAHEVGLLSLTDVYQARYDDPTMRVVLCGSSVPSSRMREVSLNCEIPGMRVVDRVGAFEILVRDDASQLFPIR